MAYGGNGAAGNPVFSDFAVKGYVLVLLALASVWFSRLFTAAGVPGVLNFAHFAFVAMVFGLLCLEVRPHVLGLLTGLWTLLGVIICSALINGAGAINIVLDFLLLAEPFLLLLAVVNTRWSPSSIRWFRLGLLLFVVVHVGFAFFQGFVLGRVNDEVKGVFLEMGAGHHVAGAVALSAALYFAVYFPLRSVWLRVGIALSAAAVVVLSDAKQVLVVFLLSLVVLGLTKWKHIRVALFYAVILAASVGTIAYLATTVFPELTDWARLDSTTAGLEQKLTVFPIITSFYDSSLNWLFGLGPGHTVGRLGSLLPDYLGYLRPLGATMSPITQEVFTTQEIHWASNSETGSSMWSLLFSWSGVWGDLGLVGVGVYLLLWCLVWRKFCSDELSRFFLINILVFGLVFSWMEEPGYMLFVACLIGVQWQARQRAEEKAGEKPPVIRLATRPRDAAGQPVPNDLLRKASTAQMRRRP